MPNVQGRNVENKIFINYAVCKFLSRIILKKLNVDSLTTFRKVEKILKKIIKIKADTKYQIFLCSKSTENRFKTIFRGVHLWGGGGGERGPCKSFRASDPETAPQSNNNNNIYCKHKIWYINSFTEKYFKLQA